MRGMRLEKMKREILDRLTDKMAEKLLRALSERMPPGDSSAELLADHLNEIRIRAGRPLIILCAGREYFVGQAGLRKRAEEAYCPSVSEIAEIFGRLCRNSPYAYTDDIRNGFLTINGGHRVGLAGKVLQSGGMKAISALNIRVSDERKGCALPVLGHVVKNTADIYNTLIISPPCAGKTTLIRDLARLLSDGFSGLPSCGGRVSFCGVSVGIVDERSEIAACSLGVPLHDVGLRSDVYDGCKKQAGILMMLRALSPKIIVTDEIGGEGDFSAIESAMNSGVRMIATAHGSGVADIKARRVIANMIREGFFDRYIVLSGRNGPGTVEQLAREGA